ncbi:hypothetical protein CDIK_1149 [Cucumispora dikerogammari]|nr:hypothetical protein CDIK_1149 [Cucumispora dikerogammari]
MVYTNGFDEEFHILCDFCYLTNTQKFIRSSLGEDICFSCFLNLRETENIKYIIFQTDKSYLNDTIFLESLIETGDWDEIEKSVNNYTLEEIKSKYFSLFGLKYEAREPIESIKSDPFNNEITSYAPKRNEIEVPTYLKEILNINIPYLTIKSEKDKDIINLIFMSFQNVFNQQKIKDKIILNRNLVAVNEIKENLKKLSSFDLNLFNEIKQIIPFISKKDFNLFFSEMRKENSLWYKLDEEIKNNREKAKISRKITKVESKLCTKLGIRKSIYFKIKSNALVIKGENKKTIYNNIFSGNEEVLNVIYDFFKLNEWI